MVKFGPQGLGVGPRVGGEMTSAPERKVALRGGSADRVARRCASLESLLLSRVQLILKDLQLSAGRRHEAMP